MAIFDPFHFTHAFFALVHVFMYLCIYLADVRFPFAVFASFVSLILPLVSSPFLSRLIFPHFRPFATPGQDRDALVLATVRDADNNKTKTRQMIAMCSFFSGPSILFITYYTVHVCQNLEELIKIGNGRMASSCPNRLTARNGYEIKIYHQ